MLNYAEKVKNDYKLIHYTAGSLNVPKLVNEYLVKEYENQSVKYLIFSQNDILDLAKDVDILCEDYIKFVNVWNIPFAFYCYYGRFNSVLPDITNTPNPKFIIRTKDEDKFKKEFSVISQLAYGFLVINVDLLKKKNILLDDTYSEIFYLQDLAEKCYKENLWISNCFFLDIFESWKYFKEHNNIGYNIDINKFLKEKERYNSIQWDYKPANIFIDNLKTYLNSNEIENDKPITIDISDLGE